MNDIHPLLMNRNIKIIPESQLHRLKLQLSADPLKTQSNQRTLRAFSE